MLCGGKPGADALQTALEIGVTLQEAITLHRRGHLPMGLGLSKFFGSIECGLLDNVGEGFGMQDSL